MKTNYLFPNKYKKFGWILFIPFLILGFISLFIEIEPEFLDLKILTFFPDTILGDETYKIIDFVNDNIFNEILGIILIVSSLLVAFSKEKQEDEYILKIRLESLVWAVYVNYIILFFALLFMHGFTFLKIMMINLFSILLFFIIKFHYELRKIKSTEIHEE